MNNLFTILLILSVIGVPVCVVIGFLRLLHKKRAVSFFMGAGVSLFILIVSFVGFGLTMESSNNSTEKSKVAIESSQEITLEETSQKETVQETTTIAETTAALTEKELFIESLTNNPEVTSEAANKTYDIIKDKLGFEKISANKNLSGTLFEVTADNYNLKVTVSDKLYMVICGDYNMYQDDAVKYTKLDLENRKIGNNKTTYYVIAQEIVTSSLKNPSSSKFCSVNDCQMARNGEYVAVKGYVDATNSFGAQIRSEFVVEFKVIDLDSFSYETTYLNIDGNKTGKYIDLK